MAALVLLFVPRRRIRAAVALGLIWVLSFTVSCGGGGGNGGGGGTSPPVATTTQLTVSSTKVPANGSITVSATISGGTTNGSVQFVVDGVSVGSPVLVSTGTTGNITLAASSAPAFLPIVGTHSVIARYSGSATAQPSQSGALNVTVTGITSLAISGASAATGANGNISLTVN
jgi:Bacterial Ig-like domain (group 3)